MEYTLKNILWGVVILGFLYAFLSILIFPEFPACVIEGAYMVLNWVIPILLLFLMGFSLFSSEKFKEIWAGENVIKKVFSVIGRSILVAITAFISWIVLAYIGFANGSYQSSTYGTPIYRPLIK